MNKFLLKLKELVTKVDESIDTEELICSDVVGAIIDEDDDVEPEDSDIDEMEDYEDVDVSPEDAEVDDECLDVMAVCSSKAEANKKAIDAAVEWALKIARDNRFHYGRSAWAHKSGCPFCGTEGAKKKAAPKSQKEETKRTYCCNPFVTAAFHHGAGAPSVDCRVKNKRIQLANDPNPVFKNTKEWKKVKKTKISDLKRGDILLTRTHAMLYIGDGKVVHAAHHDDGPKNEKMWNSSICIQKLPSKQWKRVTMIRRYIGTGKFKYSTKPQKKTPQKTIFPMKTLRFSSIDTGAHKLCRKGKPSDKPVDLVGKDSGKDWFYAPCDVVCLRVYSRASHSIWFRSQEKVQTPSGEKYLYFMCEHESISGFKAGKRFKKKDKLFREDKFGNATGNHLHCSFGISDKKYTSKTMGSGWCENNKKAWVLHIPGVTNVEINKALYLDPKFTPTILDKRIKFTKIK